MRILVMGAPGAGKGTQAELMAKRYCVPHISVGDMLRQAVKDGTPLGREAQTYMERGALVPDSIIVDLVRQRLGASDCEDGFILDGFPRNLKQAEELDRMLEELGKPLQAAINLDVPFEMIIDRVCGRRVCSCGATYHVSNKPPNTEGICDRCGKPLAQRKDDAPEVVSERLKTYDRQTKPLVEHYKARGLLKNVDGCAEADTVYCRACDALEQHQ